MSLQAGKSQGTPLISPGLMRLARLFALAASAVLAGLFFLEASGITLPENIMTIALAVWGLAIFDLAIFTAMTVFAGNKLAVKKDGVHTTASADRGD